MERIEKCPHCERRAQEDQQSEEANFAVLVSMVPLMVLTFFGQLGLF